MSPRVLRIEAVVRVGGVEARAEPVNSSFIFSGSIRTGGAEISVTVEGGTAVVDVRKLAFKNLLLRPRAVLEDLRELEELAKELAARGYRVELRVRGLRVASYP